MSPSTQDGRILVTTSGEEEALDADSMLLGRVTYEGFAAAWPERDGEFADKMNSMPKFVVSSTTCA